MMSLKSFLEYELRVSEFLRNKIKADGNVRDELIRDHYEYRYNATKYEFDLVCLSEKKEILEIYEIKHYRTVKSNYNSIKERLLFFKDITRAEKIYLAYLDDNEQLQIDEISRESSIPDIKNDEWHSSEKPIETFSEFYKELKRICNNNDNERNYFYRGHSKCEYQCIPSIYRNDSIQYEERLYHEAIRKNPLEFSSDMSTFDKLVKMQHYEMPTRLLDITLNPLVALYFACKEDNNDNGKVLIFSILDDNIKYYDSDSVCILSNLVKRSKNFIFSEEKDYLVYDIQHDRPNFKGKYLLSKATQNVLCVLPKLNNDRIIRQAGAFFIFGINRSKIQPAELKDKPVEIKIKASCKKEILQELRILGIDEAYLFPEKDKVMKQIKEKYIKCK